MITKGYILECQSDGMDIFDAIYGRSSVRRYKKEKVPEKDVEEILKAGFHAANGMNAQALRFVVMQDQKKISEFSNKARLTLLNSGANFPPHIMERMKDPSMDIFHGAPSLIFIFASPEALTPVEDGSLAAGNIMLAAHAMGYGTCFIGFAGALGNDPEFRKECNVPEDHRHIACLLLGKPEGDVEKHPRSDVKILKWMK